MPDILKQLEEANLRFTALETENKTNLANISRITQELSDAKAANDKLTGQIAAITSERDGAIKVHGDFLAGAHADALKQVETLKAENVTLKEEAKTAEQLALERTGKGGAAVKGSGSVQESTPGNPQTRAAAFAEYNKIISPKERAEYYATHKVLMFGEPKSVILH